MPLHPHPPPPTATPCSKLGHLDLNADSGAGGGAEQRAAAHAEGQAEGQAEGDDVDLAHRLTEIYDRMAELGGASAESRASKILHGLGFTEAMQVSVGGLHGRLVDRAGLQRLRVKPAAPRWHLRTAEWTLALPLPTTATPAPRHARL